MPPQGDSKLIKPTTCLNHKVVSHYSHYSGRICRCKKLNIHATNTVFQKDAVSMAKESTSSREKNKNKIRVQLSQYVHYIKLFLYEKKKQCSFTVACTSLIMY